jgi:transcriptional repressor NrdR
VDSRLSKDGMSVRRRRECERTKCAYRFTTIEEGQILDLSVVKRTGAHEPYLREKLVSGLKKALEKRSYTDEDFRALVSHIERDIQKRRSSEVTSLQIGEFVMKHLRHFDKVAYIRFASVYYSFEDLDKFEDELRKFGKPRRK